VFSLIGYIYCCSDLGSYIIMKMLWQCWLSDHLYGLFSKYSFSLKFFVKLCLYGQRHAKKGPLDITNSVDPDQPLYDVENNYMWSKCLHSKKNKCHWCEECQKVQTLIRRFIGDAGAGLGLHFLHMTEGPFSHDAGQIILNSFKPGCWSISNFNSCKLAAYSRAEQNRTYFNWLVHQWSTIQ